MDEYGFILTRHINSHISNLYWKECYSCIRKLYPNNKIIIIDDDSKLEFINDNNINLINTQIINSEFTKRGELLPYIYYLKYNWFNKAIIIHDSVFIKEYIDFSTDKYKFLWYYEHDKWTQAEDENNLIKTLNNHHDLLIFHNNRHLWKGCFGAMSVISYDFLKSLDDEYNLNNLLDKIKTRYNRCSWERVFASMCQFKHKYHNFHLLGNILAYCPWGLNYSHYLNYKINLPIIKIWSSR